MALNDADYAILCAELQGTHPTTGLPYDPANNVAAQQLNELNRTSSPVDTVETRELFNLLDAGELLAISNNSSTQQTALMMLFGLPYVEVLAGSTARVLLESLFSPQSQTRANLNSALGGSPISRAVELVGEPVRPSDVDRARNGGYC